MKIIFIINNVIMGNTTSNTTSNTPIITKNAKSYTTTPYNTPSNTPIITKNAKSYTTTQYNTTGLNERNTPAVSEDKMQIYPSIQRNDKDIDSLNLPNRVIDSEAESQRIHYIKIIMPLYYALDDRLKKKLCTYINMEDTDKISRLFLLDAITKFSNKECKFINELCNDFTTRKNWEIFYDDAYNCRPGNLI